MSSSETLGNILDYSKLHFNIHVDNKIKKCYKIMSLFYLPSTNPSYDQIWTVDLYDKPENQNFQNKLENV